MEKKRIEAGRIETKLQIAKYKQKNHEKNVKNFFKANMAMVLSRDIENSQFSTPGASALHLEEYNIDEEKFLGQGAFAVVFEASHKKTGHKVAIKVYEKYRMLDL